MFERCIIHWPESPEGKKKIQQELASFRLDAVARYINSLNLADHQLEALFALVFENIHSEKEHGGG